MTFDRPKGDFAVSKIQHMGVSASCCYEESEFEIRKEGSHYFFCTFGETGAAGERYMDNSLEVHMTKEQLLELSDYIRNSVEGNE